MTLVWLGAFTIRSMKTMTIFKTLAAITVTAFAAGCSTVATPVSDAKPAPKSSYHMTPSAPSAELATVVFVRDEGFFGMGVDTHVFFNGKKAVSLAAGEKATFNLPPDEYIFGVSRTDPLRSAGFFSIEQNLKVGKTYHYRVFFDGGTSNAYIQRFYADGER